MNMVTNYNESDLISFGRYLLSDRRKERFEAIDKTNEADAFIGVPAEVRLRDVHHADLANWLEERNEKKFISRVNAMCEESLPPEEREWWEKIRNTLFSTRNNLQ
jgi:hypothetical protein